MPNKERVRCKTKRWNYKENPPKEDPDRRFKTLAEWLQQQARSVRFVAVARAPRRTKSTQIFSRLNFLFFQNLCNRQFFQTQNKSSFQKYRGSSLQRIQSLAQTQSKKHGTSVMLKTPPQFSWFSGNLEMDPNNSIHKMLQYLYLSRASNNERTFQSTTLKAPTQCSRLQWSLRAQTCQKLE